MNFYDAQTKCQSEGANLMSILNAQLRLAVGGIIESKKEKLLSFRDVSDEFWIGGKHNGDEWKWKYKPMKIFNAYSFWEGTPGVNCQGLCNPTHGLVSLASEPWLGGRQPLTRSDLLSVSLNVSWATSGSPCLKRCLKIQDNGPGAAGEMYKFCFLYI